ncbi:MAG: hypothetical protein ACT4QC_19155 [Planctomycetaceae bacterium]
MRRFSTTVSNALILVALAICTVAAADGPADLAEQFRAGATTQGKIALGEIAAFKDSYLADVTIQTPNIDAKGNVVGTATFAGRDTPVLLQYVEGSAGKAGGWLLGWRLPTQNLEELVPVMGGIAGQSLQMATPRVIFSRQTVQVSSASMTEAVREFYREVYGGGDFSLSVHDGVNLLTKVELRGELLAAIQSLGAKLNGLVLEGVVLKNFDPATFREARAQGRLLSAATKDAELRAKLTQGTLTGVPEGFLVEDLALLVTGQPTAGVAFKMLVGAGKDQRRFECRGMFQGSQTPTNGKSGFSISARTDDPAPWRNALGIQGLELHSANLELKSETGGSAPPRMLVGVQADLKLASKLVGVAGGVTTRKGVPSVFLRGSINSLTRDDLVAMANDLAIASQGGVDARVVGTALPDFDLRDVTILYAPAGGSEELGVPNGVGIKGQLYLFDKRAAEVDALVDVSSRRPRTSVKALVGEFQVGPITLYETKLDLLLAASTESHFRASGGCDLLGNRVNALADLNAKRSEVTMAGRIANVFDADVTCTSSLENAGWQFAAGLKNDFSTAFQTRVSDDILAWAKEAEQDFARAAEDLEKTKRDVKRIDGDIAKARQQVEQDRATNENALRRAQSDLDKINGDIAKTRAQVQREREQHLAAINKAKQDVGRINGQIEARRKAVNLQRDKDLAGVKTARDRAKSDFDKAEKVFNQAVAAWKKAKGVDKLGKGIDKDAKGVDRDAKKLVYQAAATAYDAARAAMNNVSVDLDPQIVGLLAAEKTAQAALDAASDALRAVHGTAPIDSDPRVAALFVGRDTAKAAVAAAQTAFDAVHRLPVDADPRVASLFAARDAALAALEAAQLAVDASGDAVQWGAKAAAAAARGELLRVESARLTCGLAVFQQGGKMELSVAVRVMNEPQDVKLAVNTADLTNGTLFNLVADRITPSRKQIERGTASAGQSSSRSTSTPTDPTTRAGGTVNSPARPETSRIQPIAGANVQPSLNDVRALKQSLNAIANGAGWIDYLELPALEQRAAGQTVNQGNVGSDQVDRVLDKFEKTASNPKFAAISRAAGFSRVHDVLRQQAALQKRQ